MCESAGTRLGWPVGFLSFDVERPGILKRTSKGCVYGCGVVVWVFPFARAALARAGLDR